MEQDKAQAKIATHRCGAIGCHRLIGADFLMCMDHWKKVPKKLQSEVVETHYKRGPKLDASWAPWYRAKARAVAETFQWSTPLSKELWLGVHMDYADELEERNER